MDSINSSGQIPQEPTVGNNPPQPPIPIPAPPPITPVQPEPVRPEPITPPPPIQQITFQEADQPKIKQKRNTKKIITAVFVFLFLVGAPLLAWQLGVFRGDIRQRASEGTTVTLSQVSSYGAARGDTRVSVSGN